MKITNLLSTLLLMLIFSCQKENERSVVAPTSAPSPPVALSSFDITNTSFSVTWRNGGENEKVASYAVYVNSVVFETTVDTVISIDNLEEDTPYEVYVIALTVDGTASEKSMTLEVVTLVGEDTESPSVPQDVLSSNTTTSSTELNWSAATDNVGVIGYHVYQDGIWIVQVSETNHTLSGLTSATTYSFTVSAIDAAGNESIQSDALAVTTGSTTTKARVLIFTKTSGFDHNTRNESVALVEEIASLQNFDVVVDDDGSEFDSPSNLNAFDIIFFTNTSGNTLNATQRSNVEAYALQGGNFLSNHAASDSYGHSSSSSVSGNGKGVWDWYAEQVTGCSVRNNPNHTSSNFGASVTVQHQNAAFTNGIGFPWNDDEEWYYWEGGFLASSFTELLRVSDTGSNSYDDARMTAHYWERPDGGLSFYTSMGHAKSKYSDPDFVQLMRNAFEIMLN